MFIERGHSAQIRWKALVVIAFLDESGAHGGPDDVFTLGGWVAREKRWARIEKVWNARLGRRTFHMTDFENRKGDFAAWPREERRVALIAALADSIQGNEAFGTAHSVHLKPFNAIMCPPNAQMQHVKRFAYGMLLGGCLKDIIFMFRPPANEQVSVICEECEGVEGFAADMFYGFKRRHNLDGRLGGISFMPKTAYRGLQAADMLAYEAFKHITNTVVKEEQRPVRKLFTALKATKRLAIAYTVEENIRRWRDLYKNKELPPWPPK
jgi:hypothetical protein